MKLYVLVNRLGTLKVAQRVDGKENLTYEDLLAVDLSPSFRTFPALLGTQTQRDIVSISSLGLGFLHLNACSCG
eukprot:1183423-Amphidinium_carterae.1